VQYKGEIVAGYGLRVLNGNEVLSVKCLEKKFRVTSDELQVAGW